MRYVEQSEWHQVSGGVEEACDYSPECWQKVQEVADNEAWSAARVGGVLVVGGAMLCIGVGAFPATAANLLVVGGLTYLVSRMSYSLGYIKVMDLASHHSY